jgi:GNAT superfamily N-acetyltransferase
MCKAQSGGARGVRNVGGFPYVSGMLARTMRLSFVQAAESDAAAIAALRVATANDLTERFGRGHWSGEATARGVIAGMHDATIWIARRGASIVGTFRLSSLKPWAIDISRFAPASMPLYLTDMAVLPDQQGHGIGRRCLTKAIEVATAWPADAIRLDAYDAEAGAGTFYEKCEFREVGRVSYRGVPLVYYERLI